MDCGSVLISFSFSSFVESSRVATKYLEKLRLEFILEEEYLNSFRRVHLQHLDHSHIFDLARIFNACDNLKVIPCCRCRPQGCHVIGAMFRRFLPWSSKTAW